MKSPIYYNIVRRSIFKCGNNGYWMSQQKQIRKMFSTDVNNDDASSRRSGYNIVRCGVVERELSDITKFTREQRRKIPKGYLNMFSQDVVGQSHLRWMLQKDALQQHTILMSSGGAGAVRCRRLAMAYAELVQRPIELIHISPDTTVNDILQRPTLKQDHNRYPTNVDWEDQGAVRAALQGHILILDGLHRAERNVISSLKSLLARHEVKLGDGRTLVSPEQYKKLKEYDWIKEEPNFFPINEDFRILALCSKNIDRLDPALRSHFQVHRVDAPTPDILYEQLLAYQRDDLKTAPVDTNEKVVSHSFAIPDTKGDIVIPDISDEQSARQLAALASVMSDTVVNKNNSFSFPVTAIHAIHHIRSHFPQTPLFELLSRAYPYACNESRLHAVVDLWPLAVSSRKLLCIACEELDLPIGKAITKITNPTDSTSPYDFIRVEPIPNDPYNVFVYFSQRKMFNKQGIFASMFHDYALGDIKIKIASGGHITSQNNNVSNNFVSTSGLKDVLTAMFQEHFAGRDILLVAPRGEGKSTVAKQFCSLVGYDAFVFTMRNDMTANDLLWQQSDNVNNQHSDSLIETPLLKAARLGQVCILDGIEKLSPDSFAVLQGFLTDRELILPDAIKYTPESLNEKPSNNLRSIHKSFRVIALATLDTPGSLITPPPPTWLSEEVTSMFATISLPKPTREDMSMILSPHNQTFSSSDLYKLYSFSSEMLELSNDCGILPLSIRSMKKFVKRGIIPDVMMGQGSLHGSLRSHILWNMLLRNSQRYAFECVALTVDIEGEVLSYKKREKGTLKVENLKIEIQGDKVKIDEIEVNRLQPKYSDLAPSPVVKESPNRILVIQLLMREWSIGERSFLLIGNTNTGMKQFCDGICGLINHEREYIDLNQKWTLDQLTMASKQGETTNDSVLVRAMLRGHAVVINGVDQSTTEIRAMLKTLVDDGMVTLADGRRMYRDRIEGNIASLQFFGGLQLLLAYILSNPILIAQVDSEFIPILLCGC
jgi:von Willebrand factor A domain-containing protein 8